jgi:hypothetical protein
MGSDPQTERCTVRSLMMLVSVPLIAAAFCRPQVARAEMPADSLWLKAVALSELNDNLVPGLMKMHMQEMDKHGRPKDEDKYYEYWSRLFLGDDGKVDFETVKVIENGKDKTEEAKARERENDEDEDDDGESRSMERYDPFDPDIQERLSATRLDTAATINGRSAFAYEFTEHADDKVINGTAWLEVATGIPIRVHYVTDPLPKRVKRMVTTIEYEYAGPDSLIVKQTSIEATGGFLFLKKHFQMDMTFGEYWRLPEAYEVEGTD